MTGNLCKRGCRLQWVEHPEFDLFPAYWLRREVLPDEPFYLMHPDSVWEAWHFLDSENPGPVLRNPPSSGFLGACSSRHPARTRIVLVAEFVHLSVTFVSEVCQTHKRISVRIQLGRFRKYTFVVFGVEANKISNCNLRAALYTGRRERRMLYRRDNKVNVNLQEQSADRVFVAFKRGPRPFFSPPTIRQ